ncbi:MAG: hypothetical protein QM752_01945 [Gammaproteobacteria bacterium]
MAEIQGMLSTKNAGFAVVEFKPFLIEEMQAGREKNFEFFEGRDLLGARAACPLLLTILKSSGQAARAPTSL